MAGLPAWVENDRDDAKKQRWGGRQLLRTRDAASMMTRQKSPLKKMAMVGVRRQERLGMRHVPKDEI